MDQWRFFGAVISHDALGLFLPCSSHVPRIKAAAVCSSNLAGHRNRHERKFWRCVQSSEPPRLFGVQPTKPRNEAVRIVDMSASHSWGESADFFRSTRQSFLDHERSKAESVGAARASCKRLSQHVPERTWRYVASQLQARICAASTLGRNHFPRDGRSQLIHGCYTIHP